MDFRTLRAALRVSGDYLALDDDPAVLTEDAVEDAMALEGATGDVREVMHLADALIAFGISVQRHTIDGKPLPPVFKGPPKK